MIVDSSALVAILWTEPEAAAIAAALADAPSRQMSAATYLETAIVVDRGADPVGSAQLDRLVARAAINIQPVTEDQARIARNAYRDFGKGSGHPAGLNFGECFAYALAADLGESLLCKGDDFIHTDLPIVPLT